MTEQALQDYPEKLLATHTRVMTRDNAARCSCGWTREADWTRPGWAAITEFQKHLLGLALAAGWNAGLAAGWDAGPWAATVKNPFVSVYNTRVEAAPGPELPAQSLKDGPKTDQEGNK